MAYTYYKEAKFSGNWHSGRIGIELVSQNIEGNYSVINYSIQVRKDVTSSTYNLVSANEFIALDGVTKLTDTSIDFRTYVIGTWYNNLQALSQIVYHNPDGTRDISVRGYCATGVSAGTYDQTQVISLPTIPRKSSISSLTPTVDVNGSNAVTVAISRASASFTHSVDFYCGPHYQGYTGVATSQSFVIPQAWLNAIPNSVSGSALCRVTTWSGGTNLGYVDGAFTITAPATIIPNVTGIAFARDTTGTDPFTTYTKGISKVNLSAIAVTNQYSATTAVCRTYLHIATDAYAAGTLYTGASFISGLIPYAGTMRLTTIATDSRGRSSAQYYVDFTVYDYFAPSLTVSAFRCGSTGIADPSGEYLSATMTVNVAPVNNNNTKTYSLEYKKTTDSTWTPISTATLTGYAGTLNAVRAASSANTWEVRASIVDKVNTAVKATEVGTKRVAFNVGSSGTAVAIGKVAETANLFEVDLAAKFNKGVSIGAVPLLDFFYPVGTIYQTVSTALDTKAKVEAHFGGTWASWGTGRVPIGMGSNGTTNYTVVEAAGGAETHAHTSAAHTHTSAAHAHTAPSHYHPLDANGYALVNFTTGYAYMRGHAVGAWSATDRSSGTYGGSSAANSWGADLAGTTNWAGGSATSNDTPGNTGSTTPSNTGNGSTIQPYTTCYFWKRTA